ncbi:NAD-dependent epimerase/dehydratase family protein [Sphingobacterium alkalisoli]|uniref:NAD-dependent epimerase/dehydratase family protein n=1 Tax=Sphingobacterium alkalisoli TaxID=1874115 RepID=A0A4V6WF01_9SPHI|nr:NAD-dependent epimerase/dehydratase family protein [Sphingobacterium alkalisoli]TJY60159.1 NAD-dependent epimerase/dehydratase family protein [Sphingobacterium alkalisoli]GGH32281.1 nucleoside-diphosphate-sugar epimerase [Sphingobacterium alkalisoli]
MAAIIITGSSGFVGQNLEIYLKELRYEIRKLSLRNQNWYNHLDGQFDGIVHLAGKAHDTANTSADEEYFKVNTDLTTDLFEEFLKSDIRDFFYFSSVKAVADKVEGVLTEDYAGKPCTPYGKSKLKAEEYLLSQKLPDGKRLFILRPCMIHGPGNKGNLNLLYKVVEKGFPWPLADFHNDRSFLSIDNLSFLINSMIFKRDLLSGVYNFADDEVLSTNELVSLISNTLGKKAKLWNIPAGLIKTGVKIGDILPLPINSERLNKLTESYVVSNSKIKSALGIEKLPLTAKEGLEKTIRSFRS